MQKNLIKYMLLAVVIIAGVLWYLLSNGVTTNSGKGSMVIGLRQEDNVSGTEGDVAWNEVTESISEGRGQTESETTQVFINVHVCGAVLSPGVYRLPEGARVIHAIEAAGGVSDVAAGDYLNLAGLVKDGTRIYVPTRSEVGDGFLEDTVYGGEEDTKSAKININTATKEELMKLPGIGESKAESIISYREQYGGFKTIEDIMLIGGIKEAIFDRIKDYINVQN